MGRLTQWDYDIALMKLQEPIKFSSEISPICLPPQDVNLATIGSRGFVTGWGDTQGLILHFCNRKQFKLFTLLII